MIEKIKKFFSSPLKSSLFTLVLTLLIVLVCVLVIKENNKLIDFPDAEGIALEAAGIDEFDFDAYTTHGGGICSVISAIRFTTRCILEPKKTAPSMLVWSEPKTERL